MLEMFRGQASKANEAQVQQSAHNEQAVAAHTMLTAELKSQREHLEARDVLFDELKAIVLAKA